MGFVSCKPLPNPIPLHLSHRPLAKAELGPKEDRQVVNEQKSKASHMKAKKKKKKEKKEKASQASGASRPRRGCVESKRCKKKEDMDDIRLNDDRVKWHTMASEMASEG